MTADLRFRYFDFWVACKPVATTTPQAPTTSMPQPPGAAWESLKPGLTDWIAEVIAQQGWERMTPVQAGSIPRALKNQDCVVEVSEGAGSEEPGDLWDQWFRF